MPKGLEEIETRSFRGEGHIQSVDRALGLVEILAQENREISLTELSRLAGRPKSTIHGLLASLRSYGYVEQNEENGKYRLGIRLFELGNVVARSWNIREIALPVMQQLNQELGEMIQLATEDRGEVVYLEKVDSNHLMRIVSDIGARLPMHCTGLGKMLLAGKSPSEVKWILSTKGMKAMTHRSITNQQEMNRELVRIREQGYAIDDREVMDSLRCVAAPIYNRNGVLKYAVSVSGFSNSMSGERLENSIRLLVEAAETISYKMGYRKPEEEG